MAHRSQSRDGSPLAKTARLTPVGIGAHQEPGPAGTTLSTDLSAETLIDLSKGHTDAALEALATLLGSDLAFILGASSLQPK